MRTVACIVTTLTVVDDTNTVAEDQSLRRRAVECDERLVRPALR